MSTHSPDPAASGRSPSGRGDRAMRQLLERSLDINDLREHAARVVAPLDEQDRATRSLLIMRLGTEHLALPARNVLRVHDEVPVHRIPHRTNDIVRGVCNIDGALVLTGALDRLLHIDADERQPSHEAVSDRRIVMIGDAVQPWAFIVDAVPAAARFEEATFRKLPMTVERALVHFATEIVPMDATHATLLDSDRLVAGFQEALS